MQHVRSNFTVNVAHLLAQGNDNSLQVLMHITKHSYSQERTEVMHKPEEFVYDLYEHTQYAAYRVYFMLSLRLQPSKH